MVIYEITFKTKEVLTLDYFYARNILDAIAEFYKMYGYFEILKVEQTE